ncbi:YqjK-like family protein [Accumulibacter sp.]|uniref:YqjK-like family protein n=1 Tax=Accumulibacter sp. TaxID=2053492 RepID=UPI0025E14B2D|nr:YqjK-like family protein [Accumulibacter sp.]MCM8596061.1 YqjK-like family protein [Accumulibacter sp.]MCM8627038.1 YqjK-like family protein [Accumulibacter sp.]MDS4050210.1 YqjK-like family protein [Accumulibacter sp.]
MKQQLIELAVQRGRLIERIGSQRERLGEQFQPLGNGLATADRVIGALRQGRDYLSGHPEVVVGTVAVLIVLRPGRVWRWARRGLTIWRNWRLVRHELAALGLIRGA